MSPQATRDPGNPLAVALIVLGLLLAFAWLPRLGHGVGQHRLVNQPAPDFGLELVHGGDPTSKPPAPGASAAGEPQGKTPADAQGRPAPEVARGDRLKIRLTELQGRPVLVDFWATWCGPCQVEAPILSRVYERYKDRGLVVLGVNTGDKPGLASIFAQKKRLSYPILFDADHSAAELYDVDVLPTMVLVGRDGKVRAVRSGLVDENAIDAMVGAEL